jgi:RNA-directed DNA polymerase
VGYIYDADIRDFFNKINREWLIKFIEHRIADKRVVRLIQKWLSVGILEEGKPETFTFLGFTHICGKTRTNGKFTVWRHTIKKKMQAKISEIKEELKRQMHNSVQETGQWLKSVVTGHYRYYGVPGNCDAMNSFRYRISQRWKYSLERRSQKGIITWEKMNKLIDRWLPRPKIYHKYPSERIGVII